MNEQLSQVLRYVEGIWAYRWQALLVAWVIAIGGWASVYMRPDIYQASTVINLTNNSEIDSFLKGITVDLNAANRLNTITKVLLGRENLAGVLRGSGVDTQHLSPAALERQVNQLRSDISIEINDSGRSGSSGVLYGIHYKDASAEKAYLVVSLLSKSLIDSTFESGSKDVAVAESFLDTQIADYEKRLTISEQRLADFKKKNIGMMPDEKGSYYAQIQSDMSAVEKTRAALDMAKRRRTTLSKQLSGETPMLGGTTDPIATKLRKSEAELADLLDRYTDEYPDVVRLKARIEKLQAGIDVGDSANTIANDNSKSLGFNPVYQDLRRELSKADVEVQSLTVQLAEQEKKASVVKKNLDAMPEVEAQVANLNRDYEVTKSHYLELVSRRESAQLSQGVRQHNSDRPFRIIDPPVVPTIPAGPKRLLLLSFVMASAIAAGVGLAVLLVMLRRTFLGATDVKNFIGLPVLGTVSLNIMPAEIRKQQMNMTLFISTAMLLLVMYGGVLIYRDAGSTALRAWLNASGVSL